MEKLDLYDLYPIVDGCSTESIFSGTVDEIRLFVSQCKASDSSFDFILLPCGY